MRFAIPQAAVLSLAVAGCSARALQVPEPVKAGAEPRPMPPNAALKYWQAVALLPEDAGDKVSRLFARPEGAETAAFVQDCRNSLACLRQGASTRPCDWGLDLEAGPEMLLPHLAKARLLARVTAIAAQREERAGDHSAGVGHVFDMLALARHAGTGGFLIGKLVEGAITSMALETLASHLPALPPETLAGLSQRIEELPPATPLAEVMRAEGRVFGGWFRRKLLKSSVKERLDLLKGLGENEGGAPEALKAAVSDEAQLTQWLDELERLTAEAVAAFSKPPGEQQADLTQWEGKVKGGRPLSRLVMPGYAGAWASVCGMEVRLLMLPAAVDVVLHGPQAVEKHRDPYGAGAFAYARRDAGFVLTSALVGRDKEKVKLVVGEPQRPGEGGAPEAVKPPAPPPAVPGEF